MSAPPDPAAVQPAPRTMLPEAWLWRARPLADLYRVAGKLAPWLAVAASLLAAGALAVSLSNPAAHGATEGTWATAFLPLSAAWAALCVYLMMGACAALALACSGRIPAIAMRALAPAGAVFTLLALGTGVAAGSAAPQGGPSDAQLASEAVLLVMYGGFLLLGSAIQDPARADRARAALVLVGVFNLPIIYFSVQWWDTLHHAAAAGAAASPAMARGVHAGVLLMASAFCTYAIAAALELARRRCLQEPQA